MILLTSSDPSPPPGFEILRTAEDGGRKGLSIDSITVHAHEIVGIAGVSGNGHKDLVEVLGGQRPFESRTILVDHAPYNASRVQSQAHDVRVLPEEPLRNGCVPPMTVVDNLNLRGFDLGPGKSRRVIGSHRHGNPGAGHDRGIRHPHALASGADRRKP